MLPANTLTAPQATDDHLEKKNIMFAAMDGTGKEGRKGERKNGRRKKEEEKNGR